MDITIIIPVALAVVIVVVHIMWMARYWDWKRPHKEELDKLDAFEKRLMDWRDGNETHNK